MQTFKITAAALTLSLLAATSFGSHAMAQAGGVEVGGNANNLTLVNRNTNAAIGADAAASTRIGSVQDTKVGGNLNNLTLVNRNTNAAIGVNSMAGTAIGNIGKSDVCGCVLPAWHAPAAPTSAPADFCTLAAQRFLRARSIALAASAAI